MEKATIKSLRTALLTLLTLLLAAGCGSFGVGPSNTSTNIDGGDPSDEGGAALDGGVDASLPIDGGDASSLPSTTCIASGARVFGVSAFDATPPGVEHISTCNLDNALVQDGKTAGLDRFADSALFKIPGTMYDVVSCVGVELAAPTILKAVIGRVGSADNACNASPCTNCTSGHTLLLFVGESRTNIVLVDQFPVPSSGLIDVTSDVAAKAIRVIVACREGWGADKVDLGIDLLAGICP